MVTVSQDRPRRADCNGLGPRSQGPRSVVCADDRETDVMTTCMDAGGRTLAHDQNERERRPAAFRHF